MVTWFWRLVPHRLRMDPTVLLVESRLVCRLCGRDHR